MFKMVPIENQRESKPKCISVYVNYRYMYEAVNVK